MRSIPRSLAAATALALALTACGGDDEAEVSADASVEADGDAPDLSDMGSEDVEEMIGDALSGEGTSFGLGLETRAGVLLDTAGATEYEVVDETTLRLTFGDGSVDDAVTDCIVAGSVIEDDETLIVVYPDGEQTC